jgi:GAF domain-containing protein
VLEGVIDTVVALTGAERVYLMLRDKPTDELTMRTVRNRGADSSNYSKSVVDMVLAKKEVVITTNAMQDERFQVAESIVASGLRSIMCIPLILGGQVVGVLYADNRFKAGIFQPTLVPLLSAFATQAAIAIKNAKAFEEVKGDLAEARHEIEDLRIQIDKEAMQRQINEITESDYFQHLLNKVNEVRSEFDE